MVMPTLTVDTVRQLKDIISNTLATASNFLEGSGSSEVYRLFIYLYSAVHLQRYFAVPFFAFGLLFIQLTNLDICSVLHVFVPIHNILTIYNLSQK